MCSKFGPQYCCAYVDIKSNEDQLKGYWCANRQYAVNNGTSDNNLYDFEGYQGTIACSLAFKADLLSTLALILISSLI